MIPILNLTRQYEQLKTKIDQALIDVAASGNYILGERVQTFEKEMAHWQGVQHVIGCANGSDALFLALKALKVGLGDEVITTPFSFIATSESIVRAGATPVFVDIDPKTMNIDVTRIEEKITPQTKVLLPVHIFGQPAEMDAIRAIADKHRLYIVEDCAQAIGAEYKEQKVGSIGDIGCFSFFPSKNLGAFGDGGMLTTNNDELAERLRMLRVHGSRQRYYHEEAGINSRLDAIQAAILQVKLPYLNQWNESRRQVAARYNELLQPMAEYLQTPFTHAHVRHVYHQYTLQLKPGLNRERIQKAMQDAGVQAMIYYPVPLYKQQTHALLNLNPADYPLCEAVSDQVMSLPMFPEITPEEQSMVVQALEIALKEQVVSV